MAGGGGEGGEVVDGGAADDVCDGREDRLDGAKVSFVVEHDGNGRRAIPDEAVPLKLWGWCRMAISFLSFATRRRPKGWTSFIIFT